MSSLSSLSSSVRAARAWLPILHDDMRRRADDVLNHIARTLDVVNVGDPDLGPDLGNGAAGVALFLAYRSASMVDERAHVWGGRAMTMLCSAVTAAESAEHASSFLQGLTGIAWTLDHLRLHHGLDALQAGRAPRERVDALLLDHVSEKPWRGVYELGHGLVGYGVYAAEDIEAPGRRELLEKIVDQLAATALPSNNGGVTWWTAPQNLGQEQYEQAPLGHFNIGLAHGVPSVIAILGLASALHVNEEKARKLAAKAVTWLRAQKQPEGTGSYFGTIVPLGACLPPRASRVGWCFGDLGISAAVYWAALNMGLETLADEALTIARQTAQRAPDTCGVRDVGICHGAAGNAHIFNRFYQATREEVFLKAALYWFERVYDYYDARLSSPPAAAPKEDSDNGAASEKIAAESASLPPAAARTSTATSSSASTIEGTDDPSSSKEGLDETDDALTVPPGWREDPGMFGGLAGIGLTLLAAMTETEPTWDRMLLVSMPPSPHSARSG